ncbi:protein-S-isoprenylcysteine methyltransferase [Grimontia sp. AD028]|uniref:methyltransferase family protein n=1 Tax=Grimontia sp. AD028 TaxID=1581149 RepID=UPI00061AE587|nr:isoprenylcysteine carboxylmethyltransferase family protein [Grimontia sp. AD028]KKD60230.1 protein-S-isoprenylcysteine methyltransferase [Grimontia sp. AD028]
MDSLKLKIPPVIVVALALALMKVISLFTPASEWLVSLPSGLFLLFVAIGAFVAVSGVVEFRRHKTTVNPMLTTEATALVSGGIYKITRNPMYLGMLLALVGGVFYWANLFTALGCLAFVFYMNRFQIEPEEAYLTGQFPDAFPEYMTKVRRWI